MSIDLTALNDTRRLLFDVPLQPLQGTRFQPTGFPDLGAATYQAGDTDCLLVESAQSMANRLELQIWDEGKHELKECCKGLSYVRVMKGDDFLTSSTLEAHRVNSAYIEKSDGDFFSKTFAGELGVDKTKPVDRQKFLAGLLKFDANALIHGCFLESLDGRLRVARALSGFVEAHHVQVAASGGVKNDRVQAGKGKDDEVDMKTAAEGFGNVPFHREEFTAAAITAFFNLDLEQIRGYGLDVAATNLLILVALYKIRSLLDGGLRLRTACDLCVKPDYTFAARAPAGFALPNMKELASELPTAIAACTKLLQGVTIVAFTGSSKKAGKGEKKAETATKDN
jgi:CRISPR-associated protein Csb1